MPERYLGRTLGKYRVESLLGSGGFAWVYRAMDPDLEIPVALKVLKPQFAGDPAFEERFRREASTAARLRHPNIVTIYAVGREDDAVYFAMDYLPQQLGSKLAVVGALPAPLLVRVGRDVASALAFAHREGVIHRDIKPDNVLFDEHGNAIVADFGIARAMVAAADQTGTQMVVGTPHYFAPEQARGRPLDGRTDIYALGVTLYQAATGVLPFPGEDWFEVARKHVEEEPADVRTLAPALSVELARVIHCCLEKDPADRYPSAEALREALQALPDMADAPAGRTLAVPALDRLWTTTGMTARRRRLRRRTLLGAAALGVVLVGGAVAFSTIGPDMGQAAPVDSLRAGPPPAGPAPSVALAPRAVLAVAESLPKAAAPLGRGRLVVDAPPEAVLRVNGQRVGMGSWRPGPMAPGSYTLMAVWQGGVPCAQNTDTQRVELSVDETEEVQLRPRACGRLDFEVRKGSRELRADDNARFLLKGEGVERSGTLPLTVPLTLPAGAYELVIQAPSCDQFSTSLSNATVRVEPSATVSRPRPIRLSCS